VLSLLHIENIAVIECADISFDPGFNVLTGETGAGKSIVIDAINAVTGQRTSKELIRTGCDKASVSAIFEDIDARVIDKLSEYGISADDNTSEENTENETTPEETTAEEDDNSGAKED
jgi:DNA repair protein RecN (Recombination protein N)